MLKWNKIKYIYIYIYDIFQLLEYKIKYGAKNSIRKITITCKKIKF